MYFGIILVLTILVIYISYYDNTATFVSALYMFVVGVLSFGCVQYVVKGGGIPETINLILGRNVTCDKKLAALHGKVLGWMEDYDKMLNNHRSAIEQKSNEIQDLKRQNLENSEKAAVELDKLRSELQSMNEQKEALENVNSVLDFNVKEQNEKMEKIRANIGVAEKRTNHFELENIKLEKNLQTITEAKLKIEGAYKTLKDEFDRANAEITRLKSANIRNNQQRGMTQNNTEALKAENKKLHEEIDTLSLQLRTAVQNIQPIVDEHIALLKECNAKNNSCEENLNEHKRLLDESYSHNTTCENRLYEANSMVEYYRQLYVDSNPDQTRNLDQNNIPDQNGKDEEIDPVLSRDSSSSAFDDPKDIQDIQKIIIEMNDNSKFAQMLSQFNVECDYDYKFLRFSDAQIIPFYKSITDRTYPNVFDLRKNNEFTRFQNSYKRNTKDTYLRQGFGTPQGYWWIPEVSTAYYKTKIDEYRNNEFMLYMYRGLLTYSNICDRLFLYPCCWGNQEKYNYGVMYSGVRNMNMYYLTNYGIRIEDRRFISYNMIDYSNKLIFNAAEIKRNYDISVLLKRRYCCLNVNVAYESHAILIIIDTIKDTLFYFDVNGKRSSSDEFVKNMPKIASVISTIVNRKLSYHKVSHTQIHKIIDGDEGMCRIWSAFISFILNTFYVDIDTVIKYFDDRGTTTPTAPRLHTILSEYDEYIHRKLQHIKSYTPKNLYDTKFETAGVYEFMHLIYKFMSANSDFMRDIYNDSSEAAIKKYFEIPKNVLSHT